MVLFAGCAVLMDETSVGGWPGGGVELLLESRSPIKGSGCHYLGTPGSLPVGKLYSSVTVGRYYSLLFLFMLCSFSSFFILSFVWDYVSMTDMSTLNYIC